MLYGNCNFLIIFFAAGFSYGIIAIVNPIWAWKHGFRTNPNNVREPNSADVLMTKVMGILLIIIMIVVLVVVLNYWIRSEGITIGAGTAATRF